MKAKVPEEIAEAMPQLQELLQQITTKNNTVNTITKNQIQEHLRNFTPSDDPSEYMENFYKKVLLSKDALLYIKDKIKIEEGADECPECVKELDVTELANPFPIPDPNDYRKIDRSISEFLVNATVSMKCLKNKNAIEAYKNKLFCRAARIDPVRRLAIFLGENSLFFTF